MYLLRIEQEKKSQDSTAAASAFFQITNIQFLGIAYNLLHSYLPSTGSISGEYGFLDALKDQKPILSFMILNYGLSLKNAQ